MIRLETIRPKHLKLLTMSQHMRTFLKRRTTLSRATDVVLAWFPIRHDKYPEMLLGVFLYHYKNRVLTDQGIYVEKQYRGKGIGRALYLYAHADKKTRRRTDVTALSHGGAKFISKVSKIIPAVDLTERY